MRYLEGSLKDNALVYIFLASGMARRSTCSRRRCGSAIVSSGEVIGSGYNSPPGNLESQRRCHLCKSDYHPKVTDKTCCVHAEIRAVFDAMRRNPDRIEGSTLYFSSVDFDGKTLRSDKLYCTICSKLVLDAGISEFVLWDDNGVCVYDTEEYNDISHRYSG
jgi:dCMP deaminase